MALKLCILIVLLLCWFYYRNNYEHYACGPCADIGPRQYAALNPYIWPYSASSCIDSARTIKNPIDDGYPTLGTSPNVPDHVAPSL